MRTSCFCKKNATRHLWFLIDDDLFTLFLLKYRHSKRWTILLQNVINFITLRIWKKDNSRSMFLQLQIHKFTGKCFYKLSDILTNFEKKTIDRKIKGHWNNCWTLFTFKVSQSQPVSCLLHTYMSMFVNLILILCIYLKKTFQTGVCHNNSYVLSGKWLYTKKYEVISEISENSIS